MIFKKTVCIFMPQPGWHLNPWSSSEYTVTRGALQGHYLPKARPWRLSRWLWYFCTYSGGVHTGLSPESSVSDIQDPLKLPSEPASVLYGDPREVLQDWRYPDLLDPDLNSIDLQILGIQRKKTKPHHGQGHLQRSTTILASNWVEIVSFCSTISIQGDLVSFTLPLNVSRTADFYVLNILSFPKGEEGFLPRPQETATPWY